MGLCTLIRLAAGSKASSSSFSSHEKTFFIEGGFLKSLPTYLLPKSSESAPERWEKKLQELWIEHNSCVPAIVKPVNSKKIGVSLNLASGRTVIQYTMKCRWVILGSRIKYSGPLWFYHKTTYLPTLAL